MREGCTSVPFSVILNKKKKIAFSNSVVGVGEPYSQTHNVTPLSLIFEKSLRTAGPGAFVFMSLKEPHFVYRASFS